MADPRAAQTKRNMQKSKQLAEAFWERCQMMLETYKREGQMDGTEFAIRAGVHQTTVSGWLGGRYRPTLNSLLILPEALGVNPLWLFYGIGTPTDAVEQPMEGRAPYFRGRMREVLEMQKYAEYRMADLMEATRQSPARAVAEVLDAASPAATPVPPPAHTPAERRQGPGGRAGGDPPSQSASGG